MLCFDDASKDVDYESELSLEDKQTLVRYRYNYILYFCTHFYAEIAREKTVREAFEIAQAWINDPENQA